MKECQKHEKELKELVIKNYNISSKKNELFLANDKNDIFKYRAGYYMGFKMIEFISRNLNCSIEKLLDMPREYINELL